MSLFSGHRPYFSPRFSLPHFKMEGKKKFKNIFLPFLEKKKLDAYEMQKTKKELLHFWRAARGRRWGIFERFAVCLWKGIGYVFQLFPFCASLGERSRSLPARDAGARDGQVGYPEPRDPGEAEPKVYVVLGGPGGRCRALIKPGCGAVGYHSEAREGDGLCGMLTGDGCCSCLSRRLFVNINYKETNLKNVF